MGGFAALASIAPSVLTVFQEQQRARLMKGIKTAGSALTGALVGGGAGAFVANRITNVGQGNIVPGVPSMQQFRSIVAQTPVGRVIDPGFKPGAAGVPMLGPGFGMFRRRGRRMNVANVKALRRAGRRVEGFVRLAKSLIAMPGARARHPIKGRKRRR